MNFFGVRNRNDLIRLTVKYEDTGNLREPIGDIKTTLSVI
jgi:hypothetical protein